MDTDYPKGKIMAEAKDINVKVDLRFDTSYPKVPSTIGERTQALRDAKGLLTSSSNGGGIVGAFAGVQQTGVAPTGDGVMSLLRLAEYMVTGHEYLDTHPIKEQKGPSKKERRKRVKEIRRIVAEEVAEEMDSRLSGAGTLVMPRILIQEEDGSLTDTTSEDDEGKGDE